MPSDNPGTGRAIDWLPPAMRHTAACDRASGACEGQAEEILLQRQSLICMLALAHQAPNKKRPAVDCCSARTSPTLEILYYISPVSGSRFYLKNSLPDYTPKIFFDGDGYREILLKGDSSIVQIADELCRVSMEYFPVL